MSYTFVGTTKRVNESSKTMFREVKKSGDVYGLCSGRCNVILEGDDEAYYKNRLPMGWGYDGKAPDLLSVGLLSVVLGLDGNVRGDDGLNRIHDFDFGPWRWKVLSLYRLFTQQITSKLPDNWEMTSDEIEAWVKNHKELPACIRKQTKQNQRKKNGKEKAERQGSVVR